MVGIGILEINHVQVSIPVGSEKEARAFYCGVLGLLEIEKPDVLKANGGLWLQVGTKQVHLGCENNSGRVNTKSHVAYEVQDIDELRRIFTSDGITVFENTQIVGFKRFDVRDPFGNRIEFMERI